MKSNIMITLLRYLINTLYYTTRNFIKPGAEIRPTLLYKDEFGGS